MAITISANISKKVNFPGSEHENAFASLTLNAEVSDLAQIPSEAKRLYAIAEKGLYRLCSGYPHFGAMSNPPQKNIMAMPNDSA